MIDILENGDFVIVLAHKMGNFSSEILDILKSKTVVYLNPFNDEALQTSFIKYEPSSEEGVCALLAKYLTSDLPRELEKYFKELDDGFISAESNVGEEEFEEIAQNVKKSNNPIVIVGKDILNHPSEENILNILSVIQSYSNVKVLKLFDKNLGKNENLKDIEEMDSFDGTVVYIGGLNSDELISSKQFCIAGKIKNGQKIKINNEEKTCKVDENLKGTIGIASLANSDNLYRYQRVKIQ